MTEEEELAALAAVEVALSSYLFAVCGETENTYPPEGSSIKDRLLFIAATLDGMI